MLYSYLASEFAFNSGLGQGRPILDTKAGPARTKSVCLADPFLVSKIGLAKPFLLMLS